MTLLYEPFLRSGGSPSADGVRGKKKQAEEAKKIAKRKRKSHTVKEAQTGERAETEGRGKGLDLRIPNIMGGGGQGVLPPHKQLEPPISPPFFAIDS